MRFILLLIAFIGFGLIFDGVESYASSASRYRQRQGSYSSARKYMIQNNERRTRQRHRPNEYHIGPSPRLNAEERLKYEKLLELDDHDFDNDPDFDGDD